MATTDAAPQRKRGAGADPEETRNSLVAAAFASVLNDGFKGATARAIASGAGCNQAAIYYHFGGIDALLIEAFQRSSAARLERYEQAISDVDELAPLIAAIEELYREDRESGHLAVMAELVGGITANPALRAGIADAAAPWTAFVERKIGEAAATIPLASVVPPADVADLLLSVVLGVELHTNLDGDHDRAARLFRLAALLSAGASTLSAAPNTLVDG